MRVTVEVEIPDDEFHRMRGGHDWTSSVIADEYACQNLSGQMQEVFDHESKHWIAVAVKPADARAWVPIALGETYRVMPEGRLIVVSDYTVTTDMTGRVIGYTVIGDDGTRLSLTPRDYGTCIVPVLQDATK